MKITSNHSFKGKTSWNIYEPKVKWASKSALIVMIDSKFLMDLKSQDRTVCHPVAEWVILPEIDSASMHQCCQRFNKISTSGEHRFKCIWISGSRSITNFGSHTRIALVVGKTDNKIPSNHLFIIGLTPWDSPIRRLLGVCMGCKWWRGGGAQKVTSRRSLGMG